MESLNQKEVLDPVGHDPDSVGETKIFEERPADVDEKIDILNNGVRNDSATIAAQALEKEKALNRIAEIRRELGLPDETVEVPTKEQRPEKLKIPEMPEEDRIFERAFDAFGQRQSHA